MPTGRSALIFAIARATRPDQRILRATVGSIAQELTRMQLPGPVLVMIGNVLVDQSQQAEAAPRAAI